ncbi:MAG: nucleoside phosphorylase [Deltaproteobacteria bacterium]|nr:nucleoside phosphorylase [Deltaproteobacteria bacterium]
MDTRDAIIQPMRGKNSPHLSSVAVLAATEPDLDALRRGLGFNASEHRRLYISRLYTAAGRESDVCLAGPVVGAPYAAMVAETLIAWGARRILFIGWCGAVSPALSIGDLVVPSAAVIDEGTSPHYAAGVSAACPSEQLMHQVAEACAAAGVCARPGTVWTTDAVFRETRDAVTRHRQDGVLAVEMECSALFTVGGFRGVEVAALLVVSDDLSSLTWRPGFKDPRFIRGREAACNVIGRLCSTLPAA